MDASKHATHCNNNSNAAVPPSNILDTGSGTSVTEEIDKDTIKKRSLGSVQTVKEQRVDHNNCNKKSRLEEVGSSSAMTDICAIEGLKAGDRIEVHWDIQIDGKVSFEFMTCIDGKYFGKIIVFVRRLLLDGGVLV